jgi:hypothetical protein
MKHLGKLQWLLIAGLLLSVALTGLFAFRSIRHAIYWHRHRDEPIKGWMTVHYVARSYRVPPHVLYRAIGLPPRPPDKRPLREIARAQHRPLSELIAQLEEAIVRARPPNPPPSPPPDEGGPQS